MSAWDEEGRKIEEARAAEWEAEGSENAEDVIPLGQMIRQALRPIVSATPYVWRDPATIPPRDWIYGRHIQRGHVRGLIAQGGAGKTILSVGEALAMVTGRNLLGHEVPGGPKRVWLWNLEDSTEELSRIIQAACKHWGISRADIEGRLFVDSALDGAVLKLATSSPSDGLVINRPLVEELARELIERRADYLHVDPFVSSHGANENSNMEIDAIAKEWARLANLANCGVGLAHHTSRVGALDVTAMSSRGAVALINACRSVLTINRMSDDEAKGYGIEGERRRRYFRTFDDKNNRAPPSDESDWYRMVSVDLCNGGTEPGDSMGVVEPWTPPDAFEGVTADHLYRVQVLIDGGQWRENNQAADWAGGAVAQIMGWRADRDAKGDRAKILKLLKEWTANGALVVVDRADKKGNIRKWMEVGKWALQDSPLATGGVGKGGEGGETRHPHHPTPLYRGVGGEGMEGTPRRVGKSSDGFDDSQWEEAD